MRDLLEAGGGDERSPVLEIPVATVTFAVPALLVVAAHGQVTIDLLRPDISRPLRNPVTIEIRFGAPPGRTIDMQSFGATYGWVGINITRRLLEHAVKTPNGLSAENVDLPRGNHRITLSIADTSGTRASQTFRFSVAQ